MPGHQDGARLDAAIHRVLAETDRAARVDNAKVAPVVPLKPGDVVPTMELRDSAGTPLRVAGGAGRPRAVVFTAVWCETYLKDTEPDTVAACRRVREQVDQLSQSGPVEWLGVVAHLWTTPKSLATYESRVKPRVRMAVDDAGMAFRMFGIQRLPAVALINADGRLVRIVGPDDSALAEAVGGLAGGK